MWSEALQMLARAERLQREVFSIPGPSPQRGVAWEPPVDVLETQEAVLVLVALPGVDPQQVQLVIRNGVLLIAGERVLPDELATAVIHRLELPQGRFERQIRLPAGTYGKPVSGVTDGCLFVKLPKAGRKGAP
jgi:HSP20 family molecular chaperone IbpA